MILIDTPTKDKKVKEYLFKLNQVRDEMDTEEESIYTLIPMNIALKYNILMNDFMFHELALGRKLFYEDVNWLKKKSEVAELIGKVLEFEFLNESTLSEKTLFKLIRAHKRLSNGKKLG